MIAKCIWQRLMGQPQWLDSYAEAAQTYGWIMETRALLRQGEQRAVELQSGSLRVEQCDT